MNQICLVGCGGIARTHARNLMGKAELCFYSRSRESAERFAGEFGGGRVFAGFEDLLEAEAVDGLVICSPPEFHCEQVVGALEAGKSVLVEKPMCGRAEEVERIGAAVEAHPKQFVMVAENYYYKPSVKLLQWAIGQGFIGEIQQVEVQKLFGQSAGGWKSGYGALLEGGIHFVALISALFEQIGQEVPEQVQAEFPGWRLGEPERHSVTRLEYAGGATAELRYAWNARSLLKGLFQHSCILGTEGRIVFESNGLYVRLRGDRRKRTYFPGFGDLMGYEGMTRDFLDCLREEGRQPLSDFGRAKRDLEIVFEAYRGLIGG
jgi:predicted dehydrogenase